MFVLYTDKVSFRVGESKGISQTNYPKSNNYLPPQKKLQTHTHTQTLILSVYTFRVPEYVCVCVSPPKPSGRRTGGVEPTSRRIKVCLVETKTW